MPRSSRRTVLSLAAALPLPLAVLGSARRALAEIADEDLPEPVEEKIDCKEGLVKLTMRCTYYPSPLGKDAIPVLLLHGFNGSRHDYDFLATYLQKQGHAVIVPDLRGHGDSNVMLLATGEQRKLQPKDLKKVDFNLMVKDLDFVKSFILKRNNEGELNMEMLVVVGADMSTVTAMNFALRDWTAPELLNYKNCKDVKAIVLLSPDQSYAGTDMRPALKHPIVGHKLSVMIAVGKKDSGVLAEAKRVLNQLERQHGESSAEKKPADKEVVYYAEDTNLQGTKLAGQEFNVASVIAKFIEFRVRAFQETCEWTARIKP
jgi:pimeloyl-ACP methyl ester carboxylesterase